jgi:hypothetical protein
MATGEPSGLLTRIAAMESLSLGERMNYCDSGIGKGDLYSPIG